MYIPFKISVVLFGKQLFVRSLSNDWLLGVAIFGLFDSENKHRCRHQNELCIYIVR